MDISLDNLVLITHKEHSLKPVNSFSPRSILPFSTTCHGPGQRRRNLIREVQTSLPSDTSCRVIQGNTNAFPGLSPDLGSWTVSPTGRTALCSSGRTTLLRGQLKVLFHGLTELLPHLAKCSALTTGRASFLWASQNQSAAPGVPQANQTWEDPFLILIAPFCVHHWVLGLPLQML